MAPPASQRPPLLQALALNPGLLVRHRRHLLALRPPVSLWLPWAAVLELVPQLKRLCFRSDIDDIDNDVGKSLQLKQHLTNPGLDPLGWLVVALTT